MNYLVEVFGQGADLNIFQMSGRGIVVFLYALILIRISGRRSFGIRTPLDNIIMILLGAILSHAVIGVSPFLPVIVTSTVIVIMHRLFGWLVAKYRVFGTLVEGNKIVLYKNGRFIHKDMDKALVCEEDVMQGVRKSTLSESLDEIETTYMERNGEISAIKKKS